MNLRYPVHRIFCIVCAGYLVSALVVIIASDIDDGADSLGTSESDRESMARVLIVPARIEQQTESADGCTLCQTVTRVGIVALVVEQNAESSESGPSGTHVELIDVVAGVIDAYLSGQDPPEAWD